jgi:hypothetical protein
MHIENINSEEEFESDLKKFPNIFQCHQLNANLFTNEENNRIETYNFFKIFLISIISNISDIIEDEDPVSRPRIWNRLGKNNL